MAESARWYVQDSFYALIVTYLKDGSRDIETNFDTTLEENLRKVTIDSVDFKIVKRLLSQDSEIPGVNIIFSDEVLEPQRTNPQGNIATVSIHLYINTTDNIAADDRTFKKLQRLVDEALFGGTAPIIDFTAQPASPLGRNIHWAVLGDRGDWQELSALEIEPFLHRAKFLSIRYTDDLMS